VNCPPPPDTAATLDREFENLRAILGSVYAFPESFSLQRIDLFGRSFPLRGELGGDHLIFVDFARRYDLDRRIAEAVAAGLKDVAARLEANRSRVGVLVADVSGHSVTDALLAAMLHQSFLVGVLYELAHHGHVTTELFEILSTRFYQSLSVTKYLTMIYGEIAEDGTFRFISAGHPRPLIYSAKFGRFVELDAAGLISVHPVGMFPTAGNVDSAMGTAPVAESPRQTVNELRLLGDGDVLLLYTDGASERVGGELAAALTPTIRSVATRSAREIVFALRDELDRLAPAEDDMTLVAIKRSPRGVVRGDDGRGARQRRIPGEQT
jgi:serine phosphatase RsbU (regulator of sigma subunit)